MNVNNVKIESERPVVILTTAEYMDMTDKIEELERMLRAHKEYCEKYHSGLEETISKAVDVLLNVGERTDEFNLGD